MDINGHYTPCVGDTFSN